MDGIGHMPLRKTFGRARVRNQNVRILVNPKLAAEFGQGMSRMMRAKWDDGLLRSMTPGIAAWHEMGHAWAMWQDMNARALGVISPSDRGLGQGPAVQKALDWENRIRQDLYGPLGPNNARRVLH